MKTQQLFEHYDQRRHWGGVRSHSQYMSGLAWQGSKSCAGGGFQGSWILASLPTPASEVYVEPFLGGAHILLNKFPTKLEVANDVDGLLINLWRMCKKHPKELKAMIDDTLYSEREFNKAMGCLSSSDDLQRAWALLVVLKQRQFFFSTMPNSKWSLNVHLKQNPSLIWRSSMLDFAAVAERLKNVQICERDGIDLMMQLAKYEQVDMYCDPPYPSTASSACYDGGTIDVDRMTEALLAQKGRVALSGMNDEWNHLGWRKIEFEKLQTVSHTTAKDNRRTEQLWMNYDEQGMRL